MTWVHIIFYIFAFTAVASALAVITMRNPVRCVLALVVTFFSMAGIWMLLRAEFLALILLLVYVGAVMTLFLFVVMMLKIETESRRRGLVWYAPFAFLLVFLSIGLISIAVGPEYFGLARIKAPGSVPANYSNVASMGALLYTDYAYPFEIAGVLLLSAIVAAITLAHRKPHQRKSQNPALQSRVRREDCVRLVKLPSATTDSHLSPCGGGRRKAPGEGG